MNIKKLNESYNVRNLNLDEQLSLLKTFTDTVSNKNKTAFDIAEIITNGDSKRTKKSIKSIINNFILKRKDKSDIDTLSKIFILFGTIILTTIEIHKKLKSLNESEQLSHIKSLNESEQNIHLKQKVYEPLIEEINDKNITNVLDDNKYQFKFDSGFSMEALNSNKLSDLKFSLKWHKENTTNFNDFLNSVKLFLFSAEVELTDSDINRLQKHYNKYE